MLATRGFRYKSSKQECFGTIKAFRYVQLHSARSLSPAYAFEVRLHLVLRDIANMLDEQHRSAHMSAAAPGR